MDSLRQEIVEAQNRSADLIKWKLLLVSTLAATGLGLTDATNTSYIELVLCCIPFVCAYVDSLCYHQSLVIIVIGEFLRLQANLYQDNSEQPNLDAMSQYEVFSLKATSIEYRKKIINAYDLERMNLKWSSFLLSIFLIVYSISQYNKITSIPVCLSGILGIFLVAIVQRSYNIRSNEIRKMGGSPGSIMLAAK